MAEIKSALEIALERADKIVAESKGPDEATLQGRKKGENLARAYLAGDKSVDEVAQKISELEPAQQTAARLGAARTLLEALEEGRSEAISLLRELAPEGAQEVVFELMEADQARAKVVSQLEAALSEELRAQFAERGISGPALRPNPKAHPEYAARLAQAQEEVAKAFEAAAQRYLEALEQNYSSGK